MKIRIQYTFTALIAFAGLQTAFAQKKDENIGTEVVNVVKPYTPTISDAFKVKETPALEDEDNTKKEPIKYEIFSFPVASTFTPSKGRAAGVDKPKEEELFKNYVVGGVGNYLTLLGELYITEDIGDTDYVSGRVRHLSSAGGIKDVDVKDGFFTSAIDLTYGSKQKGFSWDANLGFDIQRYYYYGLPSDYGNLFYPTGRETINEIVNEGLTYHNFYAEGKIKVGESIFDGMSLKYDRFWDAFDSSENRFIAKPSFKFDINETAVKANLIVDYVAGQFKNPLTNQSAMKYGFANFGINPSVAMQKDNWSFDLGASVFYMHNTELSDGKVFVYPDVKASLKVVGDLMVFYLGADGGLDQNSYRELSNVNPFLSPDLAIAPTDRQYDLYAGLRGKLSNAVSYNVKGSMMSEKNKLMFISNPFDDSILTQEQYRYGNSFGTTFDDVKTLSFFGELKAEFSNSVSVGINGEFHKYASRINEEVWNLPELKFGANLDVKITPKWYAGASVFFVGERKDQFVKTNVMPLVPTSNIVTVDSYFDANAHVNYKINDRFAAFLKFNNIANQNYEKWLNYPVQSFQVMAGGSYKFNF